MRGFPVLLRLGAIFWCLSSFVGARAQSGAVDPQTATITNARLSSGVPLGGLGTGKVELLTDGTFGNLTLNNNPERPVAELPGSFLAVQARTARGAEARVLALRSPYGFPHAAGVRYQGLFPRAQARITDPALPVDVFVQASGILIPQNEKDSALPAALFTVTLSNPGAAPVESTVAFSWENVLGVTGDPQEADRAGNRQESRTLDGRTGVLFTTTRPAEGPRRAAVGQYALLADAEGGKISTLASWNAAGDGRDFWSFLTGGSAAAAELPVRAPREGAPRPAGAVAAAVSVPAEGTAHVHFVLAWHMPRLSLGAAEAAPRYTERFQDAWSVAAHAAQYRDTLLSGTAEWGDLLQKSSLPGWLRTRLRNDAALLVSNSLYTRDGLFTLRESREPGAGLGAMDEWLLSRGLLAAFYPALDRSELAQFTRAQAPSGEVARFLGTAAQGLAPAYSGWPDVACNYVLAVYRQHRWTGAADAMRAAYPAVVKSLDWLRSRDTDGDSIPEGGSTWEYRASPGSFSYTASLYLAALRAGEALARLNNDRKTEEECRTRLLTARANAMAQLWNGRFFTTYLNPETSERSPNLFAGALAGEWAGELLGLPPRYESPVVAAGLRSMLDLLLAPSAYTPPNEVAADGSLAPGTDVSWTGHLATYLGALAIARNRADTGIQAIYRLHDVDYTVSRTPWDAPLGYDPRTAQRIGPRGHVAGLASWNVYAALTGMLLDEPAGRLTVAPSLPTSWTGLHAPLFAPRYWAWIDYARSPLNAATNLRLKLLKKFDEQPVMLNGVTTAAPAGARLEELRLLVSGPGGAIPGKAELADGKITYTFKLPYEWRLNETIEFTVVPPDANNLVIGFSPDRVYSYGSQVAARGVRREAQIRFRLMNPTQERQIVNVRFRNAPDRNYEVYLNGAPQPRFTPETEESRLTLTLPASPIQYRRVERLGAARTRLTEARAGAANLGGAEPVLAELLAKLQAALDADETARSAQVLMHPYRKNLLRNKLSEPPQVVAPADPESAVVAGEEALAQAPRRLAEAVPDPAARRLLLGALMPVRVDVTAAGEGTPGSTLRVRLAVRNDSDQTLRAAGDLQLPEGWGGPLAPRVMMGPGETASIEVDVPVPASVPARRHPVTGRVVLAAAGVSWDVPVRLVVGHAYLNEWSVIGPWTEAGLDDRLPPDTEIDPQKSYEDRRWSRPGRPLGVATDLGQLFPGGTRGVVYAATQVFSTREQGLFLELGTNGQALVRLNNEVVLQRREVGTVEAAPDRVPIRLRPGWNLLVVKLARPGAAWRFTAEITDADRLTPAELRVNPSLGE